MGWKVVLFAIAGVALAVAVWPKDRAPVARRAVVERAERDAVSPAMAARLEEVVRIPAWLAGSDRKRRVAGHVVADRRPVVGARVRLASRASEFAGAPMLDAVTGAGGAFDFGEQPVSGYTLAAKAEGRSQGALSFDLDNPSLSADALEVALAPCTTLIHGVVSSAPGAPVAGASVAPPEAAGFAVVTDANGRYEVCLAREVANLRVSAAGFARQELNVRAGQADVTLAPAATITGECVAAEDGQPVSDAAVRFFRGSRALCDAAGRFRVDDANPGSGSIEAVGASRRGHAMYERAVAGKATEVTIKLEKTWQIAGTVMHAGTPVSGAAVSSKEMESELAGWPVYTKLDGSFLIERVPQLYVIVFTADPYVVIEPRRFTVPEGAGRQEGVIIEIEALATIRGYVTRDGHAAPGIEVACKGGPKKNLEPPISDADGRYVCDGLSPGRYDVEAEDPASGAFSNTVTVELKDGQVRDLDLDLAHSASVSGVVVDETGAPAGNVHVRLWNAALEDEGEATTAADGSFHISQLAGGVGYEVTSWAVRPGTSFTLEPKLIAVPGLRSQVDGVRIAIDRGSIAVRGVVVDERNRPVPDVTVTLLPILASDAPATTKTDAKGLFLFRGVTAPTYALRARAPDGREALGQVSVDMEENKIVLIAGAGIDGTLSVGSGDEVKATDGSRLYAARIDSSRFFLRGMKAGHFTLFAKVNTGYALEELDLADGVISDVTLTIRPPAILSGRALGVSGDVQRCRADLYGGQVLLVEEEFYASNGSAFERPLPWGRVVIWCDGGFRQAVDLVSGEKRQLNLEN